MISIIIPTYNSERTIKRCLDSIVEQTFADWEVLLMDGVSKDRTLEIARSYIDSRIRIYSESDKGIYDAMNKGIKLAKGDWLYFLGSDDYLFAPNVLETVAKELTPEYKIVYGEVDAPHMWDKSKGEWTYEMMEYNRCHQSIFYQRELFNKYGMYETSYVVYADYIFNFKCFWQYKVHTKHIDVVIAHYSAGGYSSKESDAQYAKDISWLYLRYGRKNYSAKQRKELAYDVIRNTNSLLRKIEMRLYTYYLRLIIKLGMR